MAAITTALGTLIGYVGAEAATDDIFERLQWPQRFFTGITYKNALQIGFGTPMGGPLHKTALHVLDRLHRNGLFKGPSLGNMLGTVFFRDSGLTYTLHNSPNKPERKQVRNGMWARVVAQIPMAIPSALKAQISRLEDGTMALKVIREPKVVRARVSVNILKLSFPDGVLDPRINIVRQDTGAVSLYCLVAVIWSEITGLATAIVIATIWRSWFSVLWVLPLALKLLSIVFIMPRESLVLKQSSPKHDTNEKKMPSANGDPFAYKELAGTDIPKRIKRFEVETEGHGFLIMEGEEAVILQFFRHYGHPIRNRLREIVQIGIIIAFGSLFLVGLMCSVLWMPLQIQYVWLGYQLYATLAMFVYRYGGGDEWATTESRIAEILTKNLTENIDGEYYVWKSYVYLQDEAMSTVKAELSRTYVDNVAEGRKAVLKMLGSETLEGRHDETKRLETSDSINKSSSRGSVDMANGSALGVGN